MSGTDPVIPTTAQRSALRLVLLTVFIDLIGFAIVLPLLPSYGAKYGASDAAIGVLVASYSLMQLAFAPWWGRLSDRIGRRPVLLIGLVGSTASYLLFGFAGSFLALLISRVVSGGCGSIVNVAQATLADVTPPEHRARAMGLIGAAFGVAFIVGPALGGFSSRWGAAAPGLVAAAFSGANFFAALFLLPETRAVADRPRLQVRAQWSPLLAPLGILFLETFAFTVIYAVFPLYGERVLGFDREGVSYLFVFIGVVTAVVQGWMVGKLVPRFGEPRVMVAGCLLLTAGLALLPLGATAAVSPVWALPILLGILAFVSAGTGLVAPTAASYVSRITQPEAQGHALGRLQSSGAMARVAGPMFLGLVSDLSVDSGPFFAAAGVALLALLLAGRTARGQAIPGSRRSDSSAHP
jgi:multidrug resistance protein